MHVFRFRTSSSKTEYGNKFSENRWKPSGFHRFFMPSSRNHEALYVKVVEVSNIIHRKTLRGGANWLVTSPEVASIFETSTASLIAPLHSR
jgi:hypothetical protein